MSDSLAERLKRLANEQVNEQKAEEDVKAFQARVNQFISDHAPGEFAKLKDQLKSQTEAVNLHLETIRPSFNGTAAVSLSNKVTLSQASISRSRLSIRRSIALRFQLDLTPTGCMLRGSVRPSQSSAGCWRRQMTS